MPRVLRRPPTGFRCHDRNRRATWHEGGTRWSFGNRVVALVEGGRKVAEVAAELGVSEQTIYTWRRQARIDAGLEAGVTTGDRTELEAAKRRIRELETELAIHRRATELLKEKADPKGRTRRSS